MADVLARQQALGGVIRSFTQNLEAATPGDWTPGFIQARLELLGSYWTDFQANHLHLLAVPSEALEGFDRETTYREIEQCYITAKSLLYDAQFRLGSQTQATSTPLRADSTDLGIQQQAPTN